MGNPCLAGAEGEKGGRDKVRRGGIERRGTTRGLLAGSCPVRRALYRKARVREREGKKKKSVDCLRN